MKPASVGADGAEIAKVSIEYGLFINSIVQFTLIAFAIFIVVKAINRLRAPAPAPAPAGPSDEVKLLTEIRDALKSR